MGPDDEIYTYQYDIDAYAKSMTEAGSAFAKRMKVLSDAVNEASAAATGASGSLATTAKALTNPSPETPEQKMQRLVETNENLREEVKGWQDLYDEAIADLEEAKERARKLEQELIQEKITRRVPVVPPNSTTPYFDGGKTTTTHTWSGSVAGATGITVSIDPADVDPEQLANRINRNIASITARMKK